jgi:DNA-binding phage protein
MKSPELKNSRLVSETLLECIRTGDLDVFRDVLASHIMSTNKLQLSKRTGIGRRTLYDILDPKINFNPELSTVSALIRGLAEC